MRYKSMRYAQLQIKRTFKSFPKIFLMSLLIFCMAGALFYAKFSSSSSTADYSKIKIGLVENNEGKYFQMGIYALEHMDNFRFSVAFTQLETEEEAKKMLYDGELNLYAVIPNGFIDSIIYGRNKTIKVVLGTAQAGLGTKILTEFLDGASSLITDTQAGIYTYHDYYAKHLGYYSKKERSREYDLNFHYANLVVGRHTLFGIRELMAGDVVSVGAYYFSAMILFFLLLWGLGNAFLYIRSDDSMQKLLASTAHPTLLLVASDWLSCFALLFAVMALPSLAFLFFIQKAEGFIPELETFDFFWRFKFLFMLLPSMIFVVSLELFLLENVRDTVSGLSLLFIAAVFLAYLGGCFYPVELFPKAMRLVSKFSPGGAAFDSIRSAFRETDTLFSHALTLLYSALLFTLTAFFRRRRILHE
ncbi:MAG: ABC transporter permease [Treponema sp.]|nr:ABC transporter permease [Treponema sp.]